MKPRRSPNSARPTAPPRVRWGALAAAAALVATLAWAQEPADDPEGDRFVEDLAGTTFEDAFGELQLEAPESADAFVAGAFSDEIMVEILTVHLRVLDPYGQPVEDLAPEDVVATIGQTPVPVTAVDYYDYAAVRGAPEFPESFDEVERRALLELVAPEPPPRKVVIVMQIGGHDVAYLEPSYVRGHQQSLPGIGALIDSLAPQDWVALLAYDVKLKVWSDFTQDHAAVKALLPETIGFATPPPARADTDGPSLQRWIRPGRFEDATNPGLAMATIADGLGRMPGDKDIIYVGWDVGGHHMTLRELLRSEVRVSVLDVTQADGHLLAVGLKTMATATGGTYESIFRWPRRAPRRIARSIAGHHTVTLDMEAVRSATGTLRIEVPDRDVAVHMKSYVF
ncbi:MAG: hypothetical protein AAGF23_02520 [Acidobacteriota bacterium]